MSNSVDSPGSRPTRLASKPGISRSSPRINGIRSAVPPSNGTPSFVPAKPMTAQSPFRAPRSSTAARVAFWSASSPSDLVDLLVVDGLDLRGEVEASVVAQLDVGPDLDRRLEHDRLAFLGLYDLDVGVRERDDPLLDDRVAVGVLDDALHRLVQHGAGAEDALEDRSRGLARPEAGDLRAARQALHGVADGAVEPVRGDLDLEEDGAFRGGGGGHIHRRGSIGWVDGRGRRDGATDGATGRDRQRRAGRRRAATGDRPRPRRTSGTAVRLPRPRGTVDSRHGRVAKWQTRRP